MAQVTTIGLDIAKHIFQVHGADAAGHALFRKRVTRPKLLGFLAAQAPCVVAMEACAGAHYWAREIGKLGHRVQLIPLRAESGLAHRISDPARGYRMREWCREPTFTGLPQTAAVDPGYVKTPRMI
jgi:transposase